VPRSNAFFPAARFSTNEPTSITGERATKRIELAFFVIANIRPAITIGASRGMIGKRWG
jgi:hypothetical protein